MGHETVTPDQSTRKQVATQLVAVEQGTKRSWGQIGQCLIQVEQFGIWQREADSFTGWLQLNAAKFGHTESTLWRYLSASRFYEELRVRLRRDHISSPPLESLPDSISPESIELLSKLTRVAPADVVRETAERLIKGTVTRAELRAKWQAFRPVLGGRTARGRGVPTPRFNASDRAQRYSQLEGLIFTALSADSRWTGNPNPDLYQLVHHVQPDKMDPPRVSFDAVAVVRQRRDDPLMLHGIEVVGALLGRLDIFETRAPYCDALWIAVHKEIGDISTRTVPHYVGILRLGNQGMLVERPAIRAGLVGTKTANLAKGVLLKCFHR